MSFILSQLDPGLQEKYTQGIQLCADAGLNVRGIQGWRDPAYQDQLHAQGISPLTGATSLHCCTVNGVPNSRAFDYGAFDGAVYIVDGTDDRYAKANAIFKSIGLVVGCDFHHPDYDHVQLA